MLRDPDEFDSLGRDARTGAPLPPPYDEASAWDVAKSIHDDLIEVGLSCYAIGKIAFALLGVSVSAECDSRDRSNLERGRRG